MKRLGLVFLVGVLLLSVSAGAIYVDDNQEDITLIMEQGSSMEFPLLLFSSKASDQDLFAYGDDIEDWITFGVGRRNSYDFTQDSYTLNAVKITIDIPESAEVGEYEGGIASNGILSEITIKVVPPLGDIQSMQDLEEMKEELQAMREGISGELNETKKNLQDRIEEISKYQQNVSVLEGAKGALEAELADIKDKSDRLEEANAQLTGQFLGGGSTQLAAGILIGIILVILFLYRARIGKALSRAKRPGRVSEGNYRGWKP